MDIFAGLAEMQGRMAAGDWAAFEAHYAQLCSAVDSSVAERIAAVDLDYYNDRQYDAYCKALKKARSADAAALYFEYDLDNDWQSTFFVCREYAEPDIGDDDWACRWAAQVRGSCVPKFAEIYGRTEKFGVTPAAVAVTLYLIARTEAALAATVARKPPGAIKVCIGFHDQDPIHRLP